MGYDAAKGVTDAYARSVQEQTLYAKNYEQNVRENLVPADQAAETTAETSYKNLKYATGVFDAASSDKLTLQQQKEQLIEERNRRIALAKEQAINEGKEQKEIDRIISEITNEYTDRLRYLDFNIQRAGRTTLLTAETLSEAKTTYQTDKFNKIATGNDVYSGFLRASMLWSNVSKMQQFQGFLENQANNIGKKEWLG